MEQKLVDSLNACDNCDAPLPKDRRRLGLCVNCEGVDFRYDPNDFRDIGGIGTEPR